MEVMSSPTAFAAYNFDSLLIPFRCVATDITHKNSVIFRSGDLGRAVRASMAFPFYYSPVLIGDSILYDGGIYDNFPSRIMLNEFKPDLIIGVMAAGLPDVPVEENFLSQLKTMISHSTYYSLPRETDIMIEPGIREMGSFDFESVQLAIDSGYASTLRMIPLIKERLKREADLSKLTERRKAISESGYFIEIDQIHVNGVSQKQADYIRATLNPYNNCMSLEELRKNWYRLIADDNQRYVFPSLIYNPTSGNYDLHIDVRRNKGLFTSFGGNISNNPINTGYVGLQYNIWNRNSYRFAANVYFGKYYNSAEARIGFERPGKLPLFAELYGTLNQWDYFKSSSFLLQDNKPPFLVEGERMLGTSLGTPVGNKAKIEAGFQLFRLNYQYYLTSNFNTSDTSDQTLFDGYSTWIRFERNTLNRRMYANTGTRLFSKVSYIGGRETTRPGSTGILKDTTYAYHNWLELNLAYENYFFHTGPFTVGLTTELMVSGQPLFTTYTSSKLGAGEFAPVPEMETRYISDFRNFSYLGLGLNGIFSLSEKIDFRLEGHWYQPYKEIIPQSDYTASTGKAFKENYWVSSLNAVYYSPVGPASIAVNFIENKEDPWSVLFHLGFILFNRKAIH